MSQPVSAFEAYTNAASSKKQSPSKAAGGKNAGARKPAAKSQGAAKAKQQAARNQNNKPKTVNKKNTKDKSPAGAAVSKAAPAKKQDARKAAPTKSAASKHKTGRATASNGKAAPNGIREDEIDTLVEELLGDSPSHPKKLTKAQQKKKQELEDYLVHQLELDDKRRAEAGDSDDDDDDDSDDGSSSGSYSNEFSDEYTINSYSDEEEEEDCEEEETQVSSCSSAESTDEGASQSTATAKSKTNVTAATKRKNGAAVNGATDAKQSKAMEKAAKAANSRKSLPAAKPNKTSESRRHSVGESADVNVTVNAVDAQTVKLEPLSPPSSAVKMNSIKEGEKAFGWLLSPLSAKDFFAKYWETAACLVKRKKDNFYSHLISFEAIDQMLLKHHVEFTKNIDVTSYKNGIRETLNPEGRALPPVVWDHYGQGCSIRLLNPQTFLPGLFTLNTTLQEYFHCLVGANAYLTPPNSQGFAPHYDDIEAFVLQVEGRKRWRLYKPRTENEQLPRYSSSNFSQHEIGKPIFDEVLQPGDMLYFPRGTIHQASTEPGYHSLHITLSVYQKQSYADLFERLMPLLLQRAISSSVDLRRGLPLHMWQHAGIAHSNADTKERADLLQRVTKLMGQCLHSVSMAEVLDASVDQLAKKYQHEALPPEILSSERVRTVFGSRSVTNARGECVCDYDIDARSNVRLLRAHILRLVEEEQKLRIYYYLDNSKEYCEYEPNFIEIEREEAASVEVLIRSYPEYVGVAQLPLDDEERKVQLATALWERGLLMLEKPFK